MNFRVITKNQAAEIGFLSKSILKPYGHATALPTAWVLRTNYWLKFRFVYLSLSGISFGW